MEENVYDQLKIFDTVKDYCGLNSEDHSFDSRLLTHIGSAVSVMNQMGVGSSLPNLDKNTLWTEFMKESQGDANNSFYVVKEYVCLSVRMVFDPPPQNTANILTNASNVLLDRIKYAYENAGEKK